MGKFTNITGIGLPLAVWLAGDGYDFVPGECQISATSLLRPVRQLILRDRVGAETADPDVSDFIASRLGHAIHDSIERSWTQESAQAALLKMGYPEVLVRRVRVNPTNGATHTEDGDPIIPVWIETRSTREIDGYTISGKFDMILEGVIQDFKSTSVYAWTSGSKDEDYRLQGSIYRWLNPTKVTADHMHINFIFTDWSRAQARSGKNYPPQRVMTHRIELMSLVETEQWIRDKIQQIKTFRGKPEAALPRCSDKELWRGEPVWKYYSDPAKTDGRATRRFDDKSEAAAFKASKGGKGVIIEFPGKVKACGYCPAFEICTQKDEYEHD